MLLMVSNRSKKIIKQTHGQNEEPFKNQMAASRVRVRQLKSEPSIGIKKQSHTSVRCSPEKDKREVAQLYFQY